MAVLYQLASRPLGLTCFGFGSLVLIRSDGCLFALSKDFTRLVLHDGVKIVAYCLGGRLGRSTPQTSLTVRQLERIGDMNVSAGFR